MKTPRQARSAVTPRASKDSPQWQSAADVFKSPKSPSPVRRVTRRTSVYQQKKKAPENKFKMPLAGLKSPPGVKTRTRRSSIYQKGAGMLTSPPTTRSRRASMYVAGKARQDIEVFSKVWATPVRQPEPIKEASPEKPKKVQQKSPVKKQTSSVSNTSPGLRNPIKSRARRSLTPERKSSKTPRSIAKKSTTAPGSMPSATKTPRSVVTKETTSVKKERNNNASVTPAPMLNSKTIGQTPKKSSSKSSVLTSTPSKSIEEITGKSFYGTPGETPIKNKREDDVFVFSAVKSTSVKKPVKNAALNTPASSKKVKSAKKTPKRMPVRNTPAPKRRRDSAENASPVSKRTKKSPLLSITPVDASTARVTRTARRTGQRSSLKNDSHTDGPPSRPLAKELSPIQMTSILESAKRTTARETLKRKAVESNSPLEREVKQARTSENLDQPTPRVFKAAKRSSPKKLSQISKGNESNNASDLPDVGDVTILDVDGDNYQGQNMYPKCTIL